MYLTSGRLARLFVLFASFCSAPIPVCGNTGPGSIPDEEYSIYDLVIQTKFLTSQTELVLIDRMTVTTLGGEDFPATAAFFEEHRFFGGGLPAEGILDFVAKARQPWRLEPRFSLGVRYRFVSGDTIEEPEAALVHPAGQTARTVGFDPRRIGVLRFSRVGFNRAENVALVYVGDHRPDGSGGGFLVLLRRAGRDWRIVDTEVLWVAEAR